MKQARSLFSIGITIVCGLLLLGIFTSLAGLGHARAAGTVYHVAPGGDCGGAANCYATIQGAVDAANPGDEIRIAGGVYSGVVVRPRIDVETSGTVTQVVYLAKSLHLVGGYTLTNWTTPAPDLYPTVVDALSQGRGIYAAGMEVEIWLENLVVKNGNASNQWGKTGLSEADAGGGVYVYAAALKMANCTLVDNVASTANLAVGGGLYVFQSPDVEIENSLFTNNTASHSTRQGDGGGLGFYNTTVSIQSSQVLTNTGAKLRTGFGGGLYFNLGSLTIEESEFRGNFASSVLSTLYVGHGGAVYMDGGTATLDAVQIVNNTGSKGNIVSSFSGRGGGLHFKNTNLTLTNSLIEGNTATRGKGHGGGLYIENGQAIVAGNQIIHNTGSLEEYAYGGGVSVTTASSLLMENNVVSGNLCSSKSYCQGGGVYLQGTTGQLNRNQITDNIGGAKTSGSGGGIYIHGGTLTLDSNTIAGNIAVVNQPDNGSGGGVYLGSSTFHLVNNVIADNNGSRAGSGVYILFGQMGSELVHNTIANNTGVGEGIFLAGNGSAPLPITNNIIAGHTSLGLNVDLGAHGVVDNTLWHNNTANTGGTGTIETSHDFSGDPLFVHPSPNAIYRIQAGSAAIGDASIGKGAATDVDHDIDNQPRPSGSASDLGADEYYTGPTAFAEQSAFAPQWWVSANPLNGELDFKFVQKYLIVFGHEDLVGRLDPAGRSAYSFRVTDTLPTGLSFEWAAVSPAMTFSQPGSGILAWQTAAPLPAGQPAQIILSTRGEGVTPGQPLHNQVEVKGGTWDFGLETTTQAPIMPPIITQPGTGEKCPEPGGMVVKGVSMPNQVVKIYEDNALAATTLADSQGYFTATLSTSGLRAQTVLKALTCLQSDPNTCSSPSPLVKLTTALGMFCPQASTWVDVPEIGPFAGQEVVYRFRDATGRFVTEGWRITAPLTFKNTTLNLKVQACPPWIGGPSTPSGVWITIEDEDSGFYESFYPSSSSFPWYIFNVNVDLPLGDYKVTFSEACMPAEPRSGLETAGAENPLVVHSVEITSTANTGIEACELCPGGKAVDAVTMTPMDGVTVTLMVSNTAWGGWVPWLAPATGGGDSPNPLLTGADGTFHFLAPPAAYMLSVVPPPGYQPYRSEVITQPLGLIVPLAPQIAAPDVEIHMTESGPVPGQVILQPGQAVRWIVDIPDGATPGEYQSWAEQPVVHLKGDGWDAGMLAPGQSYTWRFETEGSFPFSDGQGHQGLVLVQTGWSIYLPLVTR